MTLILLMLSVAMADEAAETPEPAEQLAPLAPGEFGDLEGAWVSCALLTRELKECGFYTLEEAGQMVAFAEAKHSCTTLHADFNLEAAKDIGQDVESCNKVGPAPAPVPGKDGTNGRNGTNGTNGKDGSVPLSLSLGWSGAFSEEFSLGGLDASLSLVVPLGDRTNLDFAAHGLAISSDTLGWRLDAGLDRWGKHQRASLGFAAGWREIGVDMVAADSGPAAAIVHSGPEAELGLGWRPLVVKDDDNQPTKRAMSLSVGADIGVWAPLGETPALTVGTNASWQF